jgi:hypothetical protein
MIRKKYSKTFLFLLVFIPKIVFGQSGGNNTYDFLNLTNSARVAALGGQQISLFDDDINLVFHNPSLLTPAMDHNLVLNYINYFAGVNYGYAAYAWKPQKPYTLAAGIHYIYYGEFIEADPSGYKHGTFKAADYALNLFYSRCLIDSLLYFGATLKPIYSDLETYTSFGLAMDAGLTYHNQDKLFTAGFVIKNAGFQIKRYDSDQPREPLPFEIQLGITQKLRYAPFRFSILGQQLQTFDLRYQTEKDKENSIDPLTNQPKKVDKKSEIADNVMRHIIVGVEFLPSKNFSVNLGYNYKRRMEMKISEKPGMIGFSWGFGLKVNKFRISYGHSMYHLAKGTNQFSIAMNLSEFGTHL